VVNCRGVAAQSASLAVCLTCDRVAVGVALEPQPEGCVPHRISDPHLQQAPWFPLGRPQDLNPCRLKALVFGSEIPDLNPEGEITSGSPIADTGDF